MLLVRIRVLRSVPRLLGTAPDPPRDHARRLPFVPGVHVSMQDGHCVAEHLVVHSPQPVWTAGLFLPQAAIGRRETLSGAPSRGRSGGPPTGRPSAGGSSREGAACRRSPRSRYAFSAITSGFSPRNAEPMRSSCQSNEAAPCAGVRLKPDPSGASSRGRRRGSGPPSRGSASAARRACRPPPSRRGPRTGPRSGRARCSS